MITRKALRAIALVSSWVGACLAAPAAFADDFTLEPTPTPAEGAPAQGQGSGLAIGGMPLKGEISLGVMGVQGTNPGEYGRYNGFNTRGIDILSDFAIGGRDPWDSGGTRYWELVGNNLVFQTGNYFGNGGGTGDGFASTTNTSLVNSGSLEFKAGQAGTGASTSTTMPSPTPVTLSTRSTASMATRRR